MKKFYYYAFSAALAGNVFLCMPGCVKTGNSNTLVGNWKKTDDFEGLARSEAVSFIIGNKAYICSGATRNGQLQDLWEYDADGRFWTQKANLPGAARSSAVGFVIDGKAYVGTGFDGIGQLKDLWEYDPQNDAWTRKADLPGGARYDAVGFALPARGYIACGYDGNYLRDCWEFTPGTTTTDSGSWAHKASVGGSKRSAPMAFVVNNTAYIMGGANNGEVQQDLWAYNQAGNIWEEKAKTYNFSPDPYDDQYTSIARQNGVAMVLDDKVEIATGENGSFVTSTWEYNPVSDRWAQKTGFESTSRTGACAFSISNQAFVLTGRNSTLVMDNAFQFLPDANRIDND